jgi:hypothetical protein
MWGHANQVDVVTNDEISNKVWTIQTCKRGLRLFPASDTTYKRLAASCEHAPRGLPLLNLGRQGGYTLTLSLTLTLTLTQPWAPRRAPTCEGRSSA